MGRLRFHLEPRARARTLLVPRGEAPRAPGISAGRRAEGHLAPEGAPRPGRIRTPAVADVSPRELRAPASAVPTRRPSVYSPLDAPPARARTRSDTPGGGLRGLARDHPVAVGLGSGSLAAATVIALTGGGRNPIGPDGGAPLATAGEGGTIDLNLPEGFGGNFGEGLGGFFSGIGEGIGDAFGGFGEGAGQGINRAAPLLAFAVILGVAIREWKKSKGARKASKAKSA